MIGRRGFIGSLLAAFAAPKVPLPAIETIRGCAVSTNGVPFGLAFHRDAFLLACPPIQIDKFAEADFTFTEDELKLSIDDFDERYLKPVAERAHEKMLDDYRKQMKFMSGDQW